MPSQSEALRMHVKHRCWVGEVLASLNLLLTGRGKVGFQETLQTLGYAQLCEEDVT